MKEIKTNLKDTDRIKVTYNKNEVDMSIADFKRDLNVTPGVTYKIYKALLTQSSTSAPTATVLENTLGGTVVWARSSQGVYTGTLANAFSLTKTSAIAASFGSATNSFDMDLGLSVNAVTLGSYDSAGAAADGKLTKTMVEIKVYE